MAVMDTLRHGAEIGSINASKPAFERAHFCLPCMLRGALIPLPDLPASDTSGAQAAASGAGGGQAAAKRCKQQ